jgi:hypothetical protein
MQSYAVGSRSSLAEFVSEHHRPTGTTTLKKGWRRPFFGIGILHIPKELVRLPLICKAAHDQYATASQKRYVIKNTVFMEDT